MGMWRAPNVESDRNLAVTPGAIIDDWHDPEGGGPDPSLVHLRAALARLGRTVVCAPGCFDLLHYGHVALLNEAKRCGEAPSDQNYLVVLVNSDASVRRLKGPGRPFVPFLHRAYLLASLRNVDLVVGFAEDAPAKLLELLAPAILVKGNDAVPDDVPEWRAAAGTGCRFASVASRPEVSTTALVAQIRARAAP
jgi:rfaE bifunctional protein nucleotidyltransferase chain/domain